MEKVRIKIKCEKGLWNMKRYEKGTKYADILTEETIDSWGNNNVILNGATGSGKTYFVLNTLRRYCETHWGGKILILCNRSSLYESYLRALTENPTSLIEVKTYQYIQESIRNNNPISGNYRYIVCDEFHYLTSDSLFNIYTDLASRWIIEHSASKIFMSGTAISLFYYLIEAGIVKREFMYTIPYDYSYVTDTYIFNEKKEVFDIINNILTTTDDKVIYFANGLDMAMKVYEQFKDQAHFKCSKHTKNPKAKAYNLLEENENCIKKINDKLITFERRLLVTTKANDNGIDIIDRDIKHIICDVFDYESAQQCLGRKRIIDKDDTCQFYIRNYYNKAIGGIETNIRKEFTPLNCFVNNREEFYKKYNKDREFHNKFIFHLNGDERDYNRLAYCKMVSMLAHIDRMKEVGYWNLFNTYLLLDNVTTTIDMEEYAMKDELQIYLESLVGKELYKDEQKELIDKINLTDSRKRQQKSMKALNVYLNSNFNLTLVSKVNNSRKSENFKKTYWQLVEGTVD